MCNASFPGGTMVVLTATPKAGSSFAGWSGPCTGTGTCSLKLTSNVSVTATFTANAPPPLFQLTVQSAGTGAGNVSSNPAGIDCGTTCSASFKSGTMVTLTATANAGSTFAGWSGGCTGTSPCSLMLTSDASVTATFNVIPSLSSLNHIIFLAQENRSFDHYFGALRDYWAKNGYPDTSFDGLPQFNPKSGKAPLKGPVPSNPGCDPASPPPSDCVYDPAYSVASYHLITQCTENTSPSWNESHVIWNYNEQLGRSAARLNGFVWVGAHDGRNYVPPFSDTNGIRAMGYYDGGDLNYYYFMASNFATSDRWFHPVMTRTHPNREYLIAATSQGRVYPNGTTPEDTPVMTAKTIFEELQAAGISWKIYVNPQGTKCSGPPYDPACLLRLSYVQAFAFGQTIPSKYPQNIAPISQYFMDLQNETLPEVVLIEPATEAGLDEHPSSSDALPTNVQLGANYVASLINALMQSSSWKNSAFILTFDEFGGLYDHVPPQRTVSPDGIKPVDLMPNDVCTKGTGPICDFTYTGYRVPLLVVSPFTKKHYVSHTVTDFTAILKLIETRFQLPALTKRDAAQMDMTEFFDFSNPPWVTPPTPPVQHTNGPCYMTQLP
jgi:phospholipase C